MDQMDIGLNSGSKKSNLRFSNFAILIIFLKIDDFDVNSKILKNQSVGVCKSKRGCVPAN